MCGCVLWDMSSHGTGPCKATPKAPNVSGMIISNTSLIHSNTALDIYDLGGETPETKLKGSTSDISTIAKFSWHDWCMFLDDRTYPADNWVLGRWIGSGC